MGIKGSKPLSDIQQNTLPASAPIAWKIEIF